MVACQNATPVEDGDEKPCSFVASPRGDAAHCESVGSPSVSIGMESEFRSRLSCWPSYNLDSILQNIAMLLPRNAQTRSCELLVLSLYVWSVCLVSVCMFSKGLVWLESLVCVLCVYVCA